MTRDRSRARMPRRRALSPGSGSRGWFPPEERAAPQGWSQVAGWEAGRGRGQIANRKKPLGWAQAAGQESPERRNRGLGRGACRRGRGGGRGGGLDTLRRRLPGLDRNGAVRREMLVALRRRLPGPGRAGAVQREMEEAVPEVVDVLRATVAAGINPRRALQAAAEGAPSALQAVLDQAIRAAELGAGAGHALAAAARAERLSELVLAGEALDLAETTGAPPGPVLAGVAAAAADRVRSRQAILAATAQARLSARVVAAMAPAFLGVLALTAPSDAAFLIREPAGWATLAAATTLELLGISWSAHIVRGPAP
jgi:hypothetical protein